MDGAIITCGMCRSRANCGRREHGGVVLGHGAGEEGPAPREPARTDRCGSATPSRPRSGRRAAIRPAGCGSWMKMHVGIQVEIRQVALRRLAEDLLGRAPRGGLGFPCSALCRRLVSAKKSSPPFITSQRMFTPTSRASGTMRLRISATPPPTAVEFTVTIVRSRRRAPRRRSSSIVPRPDERFVIVQLHHAAAPTRARTSRTISRRRPSSV